MCWTKLRHVIKRQFPKRYYWKPLCLFLVPPSRWTLEVNALLMVQGSELRLSCPIYQVSAVFRELVTLKIWPHLKGRKKFIFLALKIHLCISLLKGASKVEPCNFLIQKTSFDSRPQWFQHISSEVLSKASWNFTLMLLSCGLLEFSSWKEDIYIIRNDLLNLNNCSINETLSEWTRTENYF